MSPTIIRMTPTIWMSMPVTVAFTAQARMAPTAINKRLRAMLPLFIVVPTFRRGPWGRRHLRTARSALGMPRCGIPNNSDQAATLPRDHGSEDDEHAYRAENSDDECADVEAGDISVAKGNADEATDEGAGDTYKRGDDQPAEPQPAGAAAEHQLCDESGHQADQNPGEQSHQFFLSATGVAQMWTRFAGVRNRPRCAPSWMTSGRTGMRRPLNPRSWLAGFWRRSMKSPSPQRLQIRDQA